MMQRSERERELERARRLRERTERALKRSQEACKRAKELKRVVPPERKEKAEGEAG